MTAESYFLYMLSYQMNFKLKIFQIFDEWMECLLKNVSFFRWINYRKLVCEYWMTSGN